MGNLNNPNANSAFRLSPCAGKHFRKRVVSATRHYFKCWRSYQARLPQRSQARKQHHRSNKNISKIWEWEVEYLSSATTKNGWYSYDKRQVSKKATQHMDFISVYMAQLQRWGSTGPSKTIFMLGLYEEQRNLTRTKYNQFLVNWGRKTVRPHLFACLLASLLIIILIIIFTGYKAGPFGRQVSKEAKSNVCRVTGFKEEML